MSRATSNLIFGYGTMRTDIHEALADPPASTQPVGFGRIAGSLWIARTPTGTWAAAVKGGKEPHIRGQVHVISPAVVSLNTVLEWLDQREGCRYGQPELSLYHREVVDVTMDSGETARAWTYFINPDRGLVSFVEAVPSGDWNEWLEVQPSLSDAIGSGRYHT